MSINSPVSLLKEAFDVSLRYSPQEYRDTYDDEFAKTLDHFSHLRWCDVTRYDLADRFPGFTLLSDDAFVFFFPSVLMGLISCEPSGESTLSFGFYYRRIQRILETDMKLPPVMVKAPIFTGDQCRCATTILQSLLEEDFDEPLLGERRPVEALIRTLQLYETHGGSAF